MVEFLLWERYVILFPNIQTTVVSPTPLRHFCVIGTGAGRVGSGGRATGASCEEG